MSKWLKLKLEPLDTGETVIDGLREGFLLVPAEIRNDSGFRELLGCLWPYSAKEVSYRKRDDSYIYEVYEDA